MEQKTPEQVNFKMPPYSLFSKPQETTKKWMVAIVIIFLLFGLISSFITIAILMNQKNTEKMVEMTYTSEDGGNVHQTVYIHDKEDIAAIFIKGNKYSTSVLLDYSQKLIGIQTLNRCYLLTMGSETPSMKDLRRRIENYKANNSTPGETITLGFIMTEEANPVGLGININLLCNNVPIYWAKYVNMKYRRAGDVIIIIIK